MRSPLNYSHRSYHPKYFYLSPSYPTILQEADSGLKRPIERGETASFEQPSAADLLKGYYSNSVLDGTPSFLAVYLLMLHYPAFIVAFTAQNLTDFPVCFSFLKIDIFLLDDHLVFFSDHLSLFYVSLNLLLACFQTFLALLYSSSLDHQNYFLLINKLIQQFKQYSFSKSPVYIPSQSNTKPN